MRRVLSYILIVAVLTASVVGLSGCNLIDAIFYPQGDPLDFGDNIRMDTPAPDYSPLFNYDGKMISDAPTTDIKLQVKSINADYLTSERAADGVLYSGNLIRLARVLKRAEAAFTTDETEPYYLEDGPASSSEAKPADVDTTPITVSFYGSGAIAGDGVEYMKYAYPFKIRRWFADRYGSDNFKFLFQAVEKTDSRYGAHDVGRTVLDESPDIVFLDYSVVDLNNPESKETFESVVRRLLSDPKGIAVVILCTMNSSCESDYLNEFEIARAYGCPVISMRHAVSKELSAGTFYYSAFTDDGYELGQSGHQFFGELTDNFLENVRRQLDQINTDTDIPLPEVGLTQCKYMNGWLFTNYKSAESFGSFIRFGLTYRLYDDSCWECAVPGGSPLVYNVQGQYITLMYWRVINRTGGRMEVYVDGEFVTNLECDYMDGAEDGTDCVTVYAGDSVGTHRLEIKMSKEKNNGSTGQRVCLCAIMTA